MTRLPVLSYCLVLRETPFLGRMARRKSKHCREDRFTVVLSSILPDVICRIQSPLRPCASSDKVRQDQDGRK